MLNFDKSDPYHTKPDALPLHLQANVCTRNMALQLVTEKNILNHIITETFLLTETEWKS